jgi:hypothetical protein
VTRGLVRTKAVHITPGVHADGSKEIPELWLAQNETAKFRLKVMRPQNQGCQRHSDRRPRRLERLPLGHDLIRWKHPRHPRESGGPGEPHRVPALDSRLRGNDGSI